MVEFVNAVTGTQMWVADERIEEYKAAGHKLAADSIAIEPAVEEKPVRKTRATKKKGD